MLPIRGFIVGFALGFGSGMVFRALAENDFEPVRDVFKTTMGVAQKVGDSVAETFGRLAENLEDLRSQVRAEQVKRHGPAPKRRVTPERTRTTTGMKTKSRQRSRAHPSRREVHA